MRLVNQFDKYRCDKGSIRHRYDRVYEPALNNLRLKQFRMLEIGIFKGNSLQAWVDYCPEAEFVGIDIFTRVAPKDIPILDHPRVSWCQCDSIQGANEEFNVLADDGFDIIIDDGLHTHDAQRKTFENFIPYLNEGGKYFIEDVWAFDHMSPKEKQHHWMRSHPKDFSDQQYQALLQALEPYDVTFHDLRLGYHTDTFILEIRK